MAKIVETTLKSDVSGQKSTKANPVNTYRFSLNGTRYTIDATESEWTENVLNPLAGVLMFASVVGAAAVSGNGDQHTPEDVRKWAKDQGMDVADRGRVASDIVAKYREAHGLTDSEESVDA